MSDKSSGVKHDQPKAPLIFSAFITIHNCNELFVSVKTSVNIVLEDKSVFDHLKTLAKQHYKLCADQYTPMFFNDPDIDDNEDLDVLSHPYLDTIVNTYLKEEVKKGTIRPLYDAMGIDGPPVLCNDGAVMVYGTTALYAGRTNIVLN